jgi:hypothetical protein
LKIVDLAQRHGFGGCADADADDGDQKGQANRARSRHEVSSSASWIFMHRAAIVHKQMTQA